MMDDRINMGLRLLGNSSSFLCSIGEDREGELRLLFNNQGFETVIPYIWKSRAKPTNTGDAKLRPQIVGEFIFMGLNDEKQRFLPITSGIERKYNKHDEWGNYRTTTILTSNLGRSREKHYVLQLQVIPHQLINVGKPEKMRFKHSMTITV